MRTAARPIALLAASLLAAAIPALAAEPTTPGALAVTGKDGVVVGMPLRHTKVSIEVTAFVARATIEQVFENPFRDPVEAVYTFPLGDRAAVDDFELAVGDRTIRGEIKRRDEARHVYEDARAAGYQAALLEEERPNVFTQSVANLEPGKQITVRLRTVETLAYERGSYRLTFPLVVGPRYIPAGSAGATRISPPVLPPGVRSGHDVEIAVTIDAGVPLTRVASPSHRIVVDKSARTSADVRLAPGDTIPNKDFLLRWSVASERPAVALLAHREGLDGFFTLLVQPKGDISPVEAAPKEITFVVDTSGSMSGIPLDASKALVAKALGTLGPKDTFNLIRFAGDNEVFAKHPMAGDRASIEGALAWLNAKQGGGGTELLAAMRAAFTRPADPNRLRVVVFLTDGYVGNDDEILAAIAPIVGDARIYTVGIGSSVNHHLLDRMADVGRGAYVFVRSDESADDALEAFRSWVTLPYLTDLSIDWGALPVADVAPERLRDLGSGQTLTLVGRYLAAGDGAVTVRGRLGGRYWEQTVRVALPEREPRHAPLASLWARERIEGLLLASPGAVSDSTRAEVVALALEYRLMSPYTSFVAVDDSVVVNPSGNPTLVRQAVPIPDGVSFEGIFGPGGPEGLEAKEDAGMPEDAEDRGDDAGPVERVMVVGARNAAEPATGSLTGRPLRVVTAGAGASYGRAQGGFAQIAPSPQVTPTTRFSSDFIADLPVAGRFYQNVLSLAPGVTDANEGGADADASTRARVRLLDAAYRVLADLADDGRLTSAEGKPALAALMAAQRPNGAIASDVVVQSVATWALAEAAAVLPKDPWVGAAATKAADDLAALARPAGWPASAGGTFDVEATRWARLVMNAIRPSSVASIPVPGGTASKEYVRLRNAIASSKSGATTTATTGRTPFDRLLTSLGKRRLKIMTA